MNGSHPFWSSISLGSKYRRKDLKSDNRPKPVCASSKNLNRRPTHLEQDCWLKQSCLQGKRDAESGEAILFHSTETETSFRDDSYSSKTTDIQFDFDCLYNDSGASKDMSDKRTLFNSFQPNPPGERFMKGVGKNKEALRVTGI
jgi:hypothetical protein